MADDTYAVVIKWFRGFRDDKLDIIICFTSPLSNIQLISKIFILLCDFSTILSS